MSSLINKVKEALPGNHGDKSTTSEPEGISGPHSSRAANAADPRIDSDRDGRAAPTTGTTGVHGTHGTTHGTHGTTGTSGLTGTTGTHGTTTSGLPEGSVGPHSSRVANAADPRVDSDLDSSRRTHGTTGTSGLTGTTGTSGLTGTHGTHGTTHGTTTSGLPEGSVGPHSSRVANAADPRVDSDLDSSRRTHGTTGTSGLTGTTGTSGLTGTTGTHGTHGTTHGTHGTTGTSGLTGTTGTRGTTTSGLPEGSVGPHSSRAANAADPRIDSDLDSSRRTQGTTGLTGTTGTHAHGTHGASTVSTGPAPDTAGPHKSNLLNKADPRVDSNLDGSKTVGGNKTFQGETVGHKDPTDAAQVPPSVLQKHIGAPVVQ